MSKTIKDLQKRAEEAIENKEQICEDTAFENHQYFSNVCGMKWFLYSLMFEIAKEEEEFKHLMGLAEALSNE